MPAFSWETSGVTYNWQCEPVNSDDFFYRAVRELERIESRPVPETVVLAMYSALETRWLNVETFKVVSSTWPYIDISDFFTKRYSIWHEARQQAQGYRDPRNPCAEIPLGEPQEGVLMDFSAPLQPWTPSDMGSAGAYLRR